MDPRERMMYRSRVNGHAMTEARPLERSTPVARMSVAPTLALACAWVAVLPAGARAQARATVPLFASDDPLEVTLVADFHTIRGDLSADPEDRAALLVLSGGDTLEVELRPRGEFRRDPAYCSFPPLRLDVPGRSADGTPFTGQDKLKIVVPCRLNRESYEALVLREYLVYRAYQTLTDASFRVRLARVTFLDTSGRDDTVTRWAFFIESAEALASRLGGELLDVPEGKVVRAGVLDPASATRVALFEYMIGNTDWHDSQIHNVETLVVGGRVVSVPYDFDFSGAVDAPYAGPNPDLPVNDVKDRFYRGWCWPGLDTRPLVAHFREVRPVIEELYRSFEPLEPRIRDEVLAYYNSFYEDVNTPERAQRHVFRNCKELS